MRTMLPVQPRRILARPKSLLVFILFAATLYWVLLRTSETGYHAVGWHNGAAKPLAPVGPSVKGPEKEQDPLRGGSPEESQSNRQLLSEDSKSDSKPGSKEDPKGDSGGDSKIDSKTSNSDQTKPIPTKYEIAVEKAKKKAEEKKAQEAHDRAERIVRKQFEREHAAMGRKPGALAIYGNTLATLVNKTEPRSQAHEDMLRPTEEMVGFSADSPSIYDPYPQYNGKEWQASKRAAFVPCDGPDGRPLEDIKVFKGAPHNFPQPGFGSHKVLDVDANLCFERETRLGPYGFSDANNTKMAGDWDLISWGQLQERCLKKNNARFNAKGSPNPYIDAIYGRANVSDEEGEDISSKAPSSTEQTNSEELRRSRPVEEKRAAIRRSLFGRPSTQAVTIAKEQRTALLIRTYTGHEYSENDKQIIRSLVSELSLRTGGKYQVFLFVHVKESSLMIWEDEETYQWVLHASVPPEFTDMAILWNDQAVQSVYTKLGREQATVHVAQWLSVQKFSQEFPEYDYVWNWELDSRVTGHHYDLLEKMVEFAKKQPRRGLWERNERYFIPSLHGDYDTDFRKEVEDRYTNGSVWGPPELPFITPQGPKPPVEKPEDDNYEWGVGEEADLITVAPIFQPINSSWIGWFDVWGYNDSSHDSLSLPRRATIITQSRVSKRLLDLMHVENLRGNHVSSEMTTQTVALLHGLKAVYAPMPVYFDRPWDGKSLEKWFNGGPNGESGSHGSAYGWGREGRFLGSTWYFRAVPPQRLYLNWMGWEDTMIGGPEWEATHGRPCLPPMMLHPIKDVEETPPGYITKSELPYS